MNAEKNEKLMKEQINPQVEELGDLAVTDEQAEQAKGGSSYDSDYKYIPVRK